MSEEHRCIAIFGGSFDPVHVGHVALADIFAKLLCPDELRLIPAGNPWQKPTLQASAKDRLAMLQLAFGQRPYPITIDAQEIARQGATYTIDTLRAIRAEVGPRASLFFLIGADQLQQLASWKEWRALFDFAHICAASRPGFALDATHVPSEVSQEFARRAAPLEQLRNTPSGSSYLVTDLALDVSATEVRAALQRAELPTSMVLPAVLDYLKDHHLYQH